MKFQEWLLNEKIDKNTCVRLEITNHLEFENDELVIEGYPKLRDLFAISCTLKKIEINSPQLRLLI